MKEDISGKYIHKKSRSNYIQLKPDGNCVLYERGTGITARYEVAGPDITIFGADTTSRGKIQNGIIIDGDGEKWIREGATDDPLDRMTWLPAVLRRADFPWELLDFLFVAFVFIVITFARS